MLITKFKKCYPLRLDLTLIQNIKKNNSLWNHILSQFQCSNVPSTAVSLESLAHPQNLASLSLFDRHYCDTDVHLNSWNGSTSLFSREVYLLYSDRLHVLSITIPRCYFLSLSWHSQTLEFSAFPLTCDLNCLKSRNNLSFNCWFFLNRFPVWFNLFALLLLVIPCLIWLFSIAWNESQF